MLNDLDLDLLNYCRATWCTRDDLHEPHGRTRRTVRVVKESAPVDDDVATPAPRTSLDVGEGLIETVLRHVGTYVPTAFADVWQRVNDDYGPVTDRSIQRAIRALITDRQVASLGSAAWAPSQQRTSDQPGFYIRYDSPKLWQPGGLRDLLQVVADCSIEKRTDRRFEPIQPRRVDGGRKYAWVGAARAVAVDAPTKQEIDEFAMEFS